MQTDRITSTYIHKLQSVFLDIGNRGLCIDPAALEHCSKFVNTEVKRNLAICSNQWGCHVFVGAANSLAKNDPEFDNQVNINSSSGERTLLKKLKDLGYEIPKITKRNADGAYESKYSAGELTLQKMLVTNQYNYAGGDPAIRAILQVRELTKLRSSYINCALYRSLSGELLFLSYYNVVGTVTGRRSSKKHSFGLGGNTQNFPKHGKLAKIYRRCIKARAGHILLNVDQKGAEEWPVNALAGNLIALEEMRNGVNRHIRRASQIFGIAEQSRSEREWKDSLEYYLGKKTGHANNYGMRGQRMSDSLAQEGHSIPVATCNMLLSKLNQLEPSIDGVFHAYIKTEVQRSRTLRNPFGRERQFLGLRPNDSNYKVFNEAYSWIPQSTVGDNNGFAVFRMETDCSPEERATVNESHDSNTQDIPADADTIFRYLKREELAYRRVLKFHNGIEVEIPIEAELGYNMRDMIKIKDFSYESVCKALKECNELREKELDEQRAQQQAVQLQDLAASISL